MRQVKSEKMRQDRQDKKILRLVRNRIGQEYRMLNRNKIRIRQEDKSMKNSGQQTLHSVCRINFFMMHSLR